MCTPSEYTIPFHWNEIGRARRRLIKRSHGESSGYCQGQQRVSVMCNVVNQNYWQLNNGGESRLRDL